MSELSLYVEPGGCLSGHCHVPGDKSISHRAVILGAIATGTTKITGFLNGADCMATVEAFRQLGIDIDFDDAGILFIHGKGLYGLQAPADPIDLKNSGTSMRLLAGLLSAQTFDSVLTGDKSLNKRPMSRILAPLQKMGAKIDGTEAGTAPLVIKGGQSLKGIHYQSPMASAQVKSCLLLAGLYAEGETKITEVSVTRDHTERMLTSFGLPLTKADRCAAVSGGGVLTAVDMKVPGDLSSAAFLMVAALIVPNSYLVMKNVGINPTRSGVLSILKLMGANIEVVDKRLLGDELVADLHIKHSQLDGIDVPHDLVSLSIDEFPIIFIAAACSIGQTNFKGLKELRVKESDRLSAMTDGLMRLGINVEAFTDGAIINGGEFSGGTIDSFGDHRIAMAFSIAGLVAKAPITVLNSANVLTSFPNFVELLTKLGLSIVEK